MNLMENDFNEKDFYKQKIYIVICSTPFFDLYFAKDDININFSLEFKNAYKFKNYDDALSKAMKLNSKYFPKFYVQEIFKKND